MSTLKSSLKLGVCLALVLVSRAPAFGAELTPQELMQKVEEGISKIDDISFLYLINSRDRGTPRDKSKTLVKAFCWYKKPGLGKEIATYKDLPLEPKHTNYYKLEGDQYCITEAHFVGKKTFKGKGGTTCHPAREWDDSGITPAYLYLKMKQRMDDHIPATVEYNAVYKYYTLKFDAPDEATFEINEYHWLPTVLTVWNEKDSKLVDLIWGNFSINSGFSDDVVKIPELTAKEASVCQPPAASK